jgi:hypothetical protein
MVFVCVSRHKLCIRWAHACTHPKKAQWQHVKGDSCHAKQQVVTYCSRLVFCLMGPLVGLTQKSKLQQNAGPAQPYQETERYAQSCCRCSTASDAATKTLQPPPPCPQKPQADHKPNLCAKTVHTATWQCPHTCASAQHAHQQTRHCCSGSTATSKKTAYALD